MFMFSGRKYREKIFMGQRWSFLDVNTVEPSKSNHPGEIPKVVAPCRWLLFAGSVIVLQVCKGIIADTYVENHGYFPMQLKPQHCKNYTQEN